MNSLYDEREFKRRQRHGLSAAAYAVFAVLAIISALVVTFTIASYRGSGSSDDSARVARSAFTLAPEKVYSGNPTRLDVVENTTSGGTVSGIHYISLSPSRGTSFDFDVTNSVENAVAEVAMECKLYIRTRDYIPLVLKVTGEAFGEIPLIYRTYGVNAANFDHAVTEAMYLGTVYFAPGEKQTHRFTVNIEWNKLILGDAPTGLTSDDLISWTHSGEADVIEIIAKWEQID